MAYQNGRLQVSADINDPDPALIDAGMHIVQVAWNPTGTILAVAGAQYVATEKGEKAVLQVQFYDSYGEHLRTLKCRGKVLHGVSWEGSGLRVVIAIDSYVFFANVRPDYMWVREVYFVSLFSFLLVCIYVCVCVCVCGLGVLCQQHCGVRVCARRPSGALCCLLEQ